MIGRFGIAVFAITTVWMIGACNESADTSGTSLTSQTASFGVTSGCQGPEDCAAEELCVVSEVDSSHAACTAKCSIDAGDVCPDGEHCTRVVGADGDRAAACIPGITKNQKSWQTCANQDACADGERCLYLDRVLGARCVPLCNPDGTCRGSGQSCALHWDGASGAARGCVQACRGNLDCSSGWHCEIGARVSGVCVR